MWSQHGRPRDVDLYIVTVQLKHEVALQNHKDLRYISLKVSAMLSDLFETMQHTFVLLLRDVLFMLQ